MPRIFLDYQSGTPVRPEVFAAMQPWFAEYFGNPSSLHQHGLRARDALSAAREKFAAFINAPAAEDILFTSGGTEAVNLAIKGAALANQRRGKHIVLGAAEHPAVVNSVEYLERLGFSSTRVAVNPQGIVNVEELRGALREDTVLIAVQHVNHDVGAVQYISEIGKMAAERGIVFVVDANFSGGWLPIDVQAIGANLLTLSPHRFYGPKGVGIVYRDSRTPLSGLLHGGMQEDGRRAGTENVPAIIGAGIAAEVSQKELALRAKHCGELQRRLLDGLRREVQNIHLNGPEPGADRIPTNLNVSFDGIEGEGVMLRCDMKGVSFNSGTACISRSMKASPVLAAMGLDHERALGSVILSLAMESTAEEIDQAVAIIAKAVADLRALQ